MLSQYSPFYQPHCIHCRLPVGHCICSQLQQVKLPFDVMICSHNKEWQRNDNTGQWAYLSSESIHRLRWQRKQRLPLPEEGQYLLFPSEEAEELDKLDKPIKQLWLVDGTWQEAKKMLRQSPSLASIPRVKIPQTAQGAIINSNFQLRRNQQGLSTLEAIAWAMAHSAPEACQVLLDNFDLFQQSLLDLKK